MTTTDVSDFYEKPDENLQQGDIFKIDWIAPSADEVQRIFRCKDGKHGSFVFSENGEGKVFDRPELDSVLAEVGNGIPYYNPAFSQTQDGDHELVVVYSRLFEYFVIATQTCDLADERDLQWTTMLPVITLEYICKNEIRQLKNTKSETTIHDFCCINGVDALPLKEKTGKGYCQLISEIVNKSVKNGASKNIKGDMGTIKTYLSNLNQPGYLYYLQESPNWELPEAVIDFTATFTVPKIKLEEIKGKRLVKIANDYRNEFSKKLGTFFSRIATPASMVPAIKNKPQNPNLKE